MMTPYTITDVKEFRSSKKFTGLEIAYLIKENGLEDHTLRSVEKVYVQPTGLSMPGNNYVHIVTFERINK